MKEHKIIAITGPTASGKTSLAINIAKKINGEIISVDSRQIYKELNIGSAKPTEAEKQGIVHHLIDIVNLTDEYTVADFCDDARNKIKEIIQKDKVPVLAGGTGLYFRVLLQDFDLPRVAPNKELREELSRKTNEELYDLLSKLDIESAKKIHCNNKVKIIRALEVCITLKIPMSKAQKKKESEYKTLWFGLNAQNRDFLYERANKRVDIMIQSGLLDEAKILYEKYPENNILLNTIGYQELLPFIKNETGLDSAVNEMKQNTRRYIKRQISWFKANNEINWFNIENTKEDSISESILMKYKNL